MTARRIREWPRVVVATVAVAILLVVIGVVAASASSGGSSNPAVTAALRDRNASQAAALHRDEQTLASVRGQLATASSELELTRTQLARSRARARCWKQVALHRGGKRAPNCAAVT